MTAGTAVADIGGYPLSAEDATLWQTAAAAAGRGDPAGAAAAMHTLMERRPDLLPAGIQAAHFLAAAGAWRDAETTALAGAASCRAQPPRSPDMAAALVKLLRQFEAHPQMADVVDGMDWNTCRDPGLLVDLVQTLAPLGLYPQAERLLARAEALAPGHPQLEYVRGIFAFVRGDAATSEQHLARAAAALPARAAHIGWLRAMQAERSNPETLRTQITALRAARTAPGSEDAAFRAFGLHQLLHALGDHAAAWDALTEANAIKAASNRYNRDTDTTLFTALHALPPSVAGAQTQADPGPLPPTRTLFIVGMHRSGTSVLERVLAGHSHVMDGGENHVFPAAMRSATNHRGEGIIDATMVERAARLDDAEWAAIGRRMDAYAAWRAQGKTWFVEKLPPNALHVGFILRAMPHARVVWMQRDPVDTCFSNLRTYFADGIAPYANDQRDLADYRLRHDALMTHWLTRAEGRMLRLDYADFIADPDTQTRRVCTALDLAFEPDMLEVGRDAGYTATASIAQVRRGILRDRGGAWRPYAAWLHPLLEGLGIASDQATDPR